MKPFGLLLATAICAASLAGGSSPYLPYNAVKYIPASSQQGEYETTSATEEQEKGGTTMKEEPLKQPRSYFSPDSVRDRYAQHMNEETAQDTDPLLDIARDSIKLMRADNRSDEEIRSMLKTHCHFSDKIIADLLNE